MFHLVKTSQSDLKKLSECHKICFVNSFSVRAGDRYTLKSFEWFLSNQNTFLFHAERDEKVVGYCGGFKASYTGDGSTSAMLQYAMAEAIKGMIKRPYLLFHPELVKRYPLILKNLRRRIFKSKSHVFAPHNDFSALKIGLVVIGVLPEYRGKGVFELLMHQFEEECKKRNAEKMILSVKATNARAIAAYKKVGWQIASQTKNGIEMFKEISR